jgi:catechol 2,3-dioxygenase-like lactoylglutathione lyase family enzyme
MAGERTYPILPCPDIDEAIAFYGALGFTRTYRQLAPNPCAVVALEEIQIHLCGIPGFNPADSYGSAIIVVPDVDALYHAFAAGLRKAYGKLPVAGFPRILRPRKKYGTVTGFSVVDVGGNWLRFYKLGANEEDDSEAKATGLLKRLEVATRLGDAHGDERKALKALEDGLRQYPEAPAPEVARVMLYRTELAVRLGDADLARTSLSGVIALKLKKAEKEEIASELAHARELVSSIR